MSINLKNQSIKGQRSSILELFNSLSPSENIQEKTKTPLKATLLKNQQAQIKGSLRHGLSKKFPGESSEVFLDNGDVAEENNRELLDVKKNFDGLEKWTNNLEQRKRKLSQVMRNMSKFEEVRSQSSEITLYDERRLLMQTEDLDPKLSSNLIDSILNYDKKNANLYKNTDLFEKPLILNKSNNLNSEKIFRSIDAKKHELNKKLLNEVILNRLLLERRKNKSKSWSIPDFVINEQNALHDSINNFKTLSLLMNKASTEHILNREYLKDKIKSQLKKQENYNLLIDKEELKRLKNLKEEFLEELKKNQKDFEENQMEINKRNKIIKQFRFEICNHRKQISSQYINIQDIRMHFDEMENALDRANKKNYRQVLDRRTTNASSSVNNFMMSNKIRNDRINQMEAIEKFIKNTQNQMNLSLTKIDSIEFELKELKLQKDQARIRQKEIYITILNHPNFNFFFPQSLTWIYKNLISMNDDFPEEIFPNFLTEADLNYLKEISLIEIEIETEKAETKNNSYKKDKSVFETMNITDSKRKISEVQEKFKQFKRQSLKVQELDTKNLDLRKMNDIQMDLDDYDDNHNNDIEIKNNYDSKEIHEESVYNKNGISNNDLFTFKSNIEKETNSLEHDFRKMMFQRSKSKRELQNQKTFIDNNRKSQLKIERSLEDKHQKIQELKNHKIAQLIQEYGVINIDEKILGRLKKRVHLLFGVKQGDKFIEENYKENAAFKIEDQVNNQSEQGHKFIEKKMEKFKKIKNEEINREINYRFNPIYNQFPSLVNENNPNSTYLSTKRYIKH